MVTARDLATPSDHVPSSVGRASMTIAGIVTLGAIISLTAGIGCAVAAGASGMVTAAATTVLVTFPAASPASSVRS